MGYYATLYALFSFIYENRILTYILLALNFITSCSDTKPDTLLGETTGDSKEGFTFCQKLPMPISLSRLHLKHHRPQTYTDMRVRYIFIPEWSGREYGCMFLPNGMKILKM